MKTSVVGFPRIGELRELKFATEKYWRGELPEEKLQETARSLRERNWKLQQEAGNDGIPSNDFSFYDGLLDTAVLFHIIPKRYRELSLSGLDTYFAMARGYQGENGDVKALAMKKWFNTNYHYMVPEYEDGTEIKLAGTKPLEEYREAKALGIQTKVTLVGPFTLLKLTRFTGNTTAEELSIPLAGAYKELLAQLAAEGAEWIQFEEPYLVHDLEEEDITLFESLYQSILSGGAGCRTLLQTYFGDVRDIYQKLTGLAFDAIGLDFVEGRETLGLIRQYGFPQDKLLVAGVLNGRNIWKNRYADTLAVLTELKELGIQAVPGTSCSLLHVPYTLKNETKLPDKYTRHFAFAEEKLAELKELSVLAQIDPERVGGEAAYAANEALFQNRPDVVNESVQKRVAAIKESDYTRLPVFEERERIQKELWKLPLFPTTTIGSFPQAKDVKQNRSAFRKGEITEEAYREFNRNKIAACIREQEEIGLDVLVHGEYERNDMVEYFGEHLDGYLFTEKAWVQSYGSRCVKPPVIWGDISRTGPITVEWSEYAKSCTDKPVKGMLTGPVTILNWSFPREDISIRESTLQIALAIRDEVLDLETAGIQIIQIDEAALREKLPLRRSDWYSEYLDWAIPAFRLVHSGVKPETQIHTHMCYSEFTDIIPAIDQMDADVITFEASRSDLLILDSLKENHFKTEVGPGVYDIHSPRVPSEEEIVTALEKMLGRIEKEKLWVNPDCGLKTRGEAETKVSLMHLVAAAKKLRESYGA